MLTRRDLAAVAVATAAKSDLRAVLVKTVAMITLAENGSRRWMRDLDALQADVTGGWDGEDSEAHQRRLDQGVPYILASYHYKIL